MKVLFMDVDGVLNDEDWWRTRSPKPDPRHPPEILVKNIDTSRVILINEIVARTGCEVVLSSATRSNPLMPEVLLLAGLAKPLLGAIPIMQFAHTFRDFDGAERTLWIEKTRAEEVEEWLRLNPGVEAYAVVDDQDHGWAEAMESRLVRTSMATGLTQDHVEAIVELLR